MHNLIEETLLAKTGYPECMKRKNRYIYPNEYLKPLHGKSYNQVKKTRLDLKKYLQSIISKCDNK